MAYLPPLHRRSNIALERASYFEPAGDGIFDVNLADILGPASHLQPIQMRVALEKHLQALHPEKVDFYEETPSEHCIVIQARDYHYLPQNGVMQRVFHDLVGQRNGNYFYRWVATDKRRLKLFPTISSGKRNLEFYRDYTAQ